ncbi:MAG: aminoacyl-tRNA hydrolase [Alphaproteobacteria bacterium]|nr:aminoacyl-tRNA hydrolase [Alphaproteobacteria bacterium]
MLLLVGLGNPGRDYAGNRHNIGFMALDRMAGVHGFSPFREKFQGELSQGEIAQEKALAFRPLTYMNDSGRAVGEAARFFKVPPERIFVFYDELDLAPGKLRVKFGGGAAGHNGIRSIDSHLGPDFWRIRLGIGHPGHRDKVTGHVLKDFAKQDKAWLDPLLDAIAEALPLLVAGEEESFMTKVALLAPPPSQEKEPGEGDDAPAGKENQEPDPD